MDANGLGTHLVPDAASATHATYALLLHLDTPVASRNLGIPNLIEMRGSDVVSGRFLPVIFVPLSCASPHTCDTGKVVDYVWSPHREDLDLWYRVKDVLNWPNDYRQ